MSDPGSPLRPKVVITGTGRAGTTLLVQVLTDLGLDTGYTSGAEGDTRVHGGLEKDILSPDAPWIVKGPALSGQLGPLLEAGKVAVEHVIVPMRELKVAAASRVRSTRYGSNLRTPGGLLGTPNATRQLEVLAVMQYELFFTAARFELPLTLLEFPRFASDWQYAHRQLGWLDPSIPPEEWQRVLTARYRPTWIHQGALSRRERLLTMVGTGFNRGVKAPARAVRRLASGGTAHAEPSEPGTA